MSLPSSRLLWSYAQRASAIDGPDDNYDANRDIRLLLSGEPAARSCTVAVKTKTMTKAGLEGPDTD
ncbi:MAG TPA: hypothetical protein VFA43_22065 [Gemmatimonadaceae bacterium]|nr:hypothetical protein [Gemmatimonadaceae bacterium]